MITEQQISDYIASLPEAKRTDMQTLHDLVLKIRPEDKLWFFDGKNAEGKAVTNPNIGFGTCTLKYTDGSSREFYRIGLSANTSGISVYVMGLEDKEYLKQTYGATLGKASVTGYCIRFKKLADIDVDVLMEAVRYGLEQ